MRRRGFGSTSNNPMSREIALDFSQTFLAMLLRLVGTADTAGDCEKIPFARLSHVKVFQNLVEVSSISLSTSPQSRSTWDTHQLVSLGGLRHGEGSMPTIAQRVQLPIISHHIQWVVYEFLGKSLATCIDLSSPVFLHSTNQFWSTSSAQTCAPPHQSVQHC